MPAAEPFDLDVNSARQWCIDKLGFEPDTVTELTGGISSNVLLAERGPMRAVIKQSLPQLKVQAEWLCDRRRALREAAALQVFSDIPIRRSVPSLLAVDEERFAFAMSAAPSDWVPWKARLMQGRYDADSARSAGEALRVLISETTSQFFADRFADLRIFDDLRLDAYYRYTAERHPDLRGYFEALISDCLENRQCLVHGDYSPKNILTDGTSVLAIDWECVHYGNPAFDTAFLLNHLLLKSFLHPDATADLAHLADDFWNSVAPSDELTNATLRHWPGLLPARMDGKSPVEYIRDPHAKDRIREFARELIDVRPTSIREVFERRVSYNG